jgi:hypothetical protein
MSVSGKFESVYLEFGDGQFTKHPMESLRFNGADITFVTKIKSSAATLCDNIPLIWRKDEALKDLLEKKKITPEVFQDLHGSFTSVLASLKKDAQVIIDEAAIEIERCRDEITSLAYAIANLEIEHEIGKVDEANYTSAFALLQESLRRATSERTDYELTKSKLSSCLLGEQTSPKTTQIFAGPVAATAPAVAAATKLPEPPVVVYVKDMGKAGI